MNVTTSITPAEHNVNIRRRVCDWLPWNDNQASRAEKAERKMSWRPEGNTIQCNVNFNIIVKSSVLKAAENSSLHPLQPTRNMTACLIKDIQDELYSSLIEYLVKWIWTYCLRDCITSLTQPLGPAVVLFIKSHDPFLSTQSFESCVGSVNRYNCQLYCQFSSQNNLWMIFSLNHFLKPSCLFKSPKHQKYGRWKKASHLIIFQINIDAQIPFLNMFRSFCHVRWTKSQFF